MTERPDRTPPPRASQDPAPADRAARQAKALRDNLARRKAQKRARATAAPAADPSQEQ